MAIASPARTDKDQVRQAAAARAASGEVSLVLGIDIGGTTTHAVLTRFDGTLAGHETCLTPAHAGGEAIVEAIASLVARLTVDGQRPVAAGVGAAGTIAWPQGTITFASDSFRGWTGFPLAAALTEILGMPVAADNDVNAFLLGEATWGAAAGLRDVLGITLGTGVGGALLLDGQLFRGDDGWAGEIGHIAGFSDLTCTCGQKGHLETLACGRAIATRYREAAGTSGPITAAEIAPRARRGDAAASQVFEDAGQALGKALALTGTLLDISAVVIGGGLTGGWDLLSPAVERQLELAPPVSGRAMAIRLSRLGTFAVAQGAAALALSQLRPAHRPA